MMGWNTQEPVFDEIVGGVIYLLLQRTTFPLGSSAHPYRDGGIYRETLE